MAGGYADIRKQAAGMGITVNALTCGWGADYTDAEKETSFDGWARKDMNMTRRQFARAAMVGGAAAACAPWGFAFRNTLQLGLNTWSLRALPHDTTLAAVRKVMRDQNLHNCQMLFLHVEPSQFSPVIPVAGPNLPAAAPVPPTPEQTEQRRAQAAARSEWRLSVPMSYFEEIRSAFAESATQTPHSPSAEPLQFTNNTGRAIGGAVAFTPLKMLAKKRGSSPGFFFRTPTALRPHRSART